MNLDELQLHCEEARLIGEMIGTLEGVLWCCECDNINRKQIENLLKRYKKFYQEKELGPK